ncbi:MAG TPA: hypothetical protein VF173_00110 [Thermoanaerobaculia bacterium]|nr:hypothetical protein [Thermoanaerobaculia bacterium]
MIRKALILLLALCFCAPAFAAVSIACPAANTVKVHRIPHSINSYFTAVSDGVEFGGFGFGWNLDGVLIKAQVTDFNGSWSMVCTYGPQGFTESLQSSSSQTFKSCTFANGTQTCNGSIQQCTLSCPSQPTFTTAADAKKKK